MTLSTFLATVAVIVTVGPHAVTQTSSALGQAARYEEPDFVFPADLAEQVETSDVVVIARLVKRLEPRLFTSTLTRLGKPVEYRQPYATYLIRVERVLKADPRWAFDGEQIVEQAVGTQGLAEFRRGEPSLEGDEVMLFLGYHEYLKRFQFSTWSVQYRHKSDGTVQTVRDDGPMTSVGKKHPIIGASRGNRASTDWVNLVQEVELLVATKGR